MTVIEAYLVAPGTSVTLNYIPVMTPGLYDTFPGTPHKFPGHIGPFPGLLLMEILIFNPRSGGKISIFPKSRKWTNMPRKRIRRARRSRMPVWGSRICITRYKKDSTDPGIV